MTTLHFVASGKANVGKTAFTEALNAIALGNEHKPLLVDADIHRQTLSKHYDVKRTVVMSDDPVYEGQPDEFWELVSEGKGDVIVDLAGQSDKLLNQWLDVRGIEYAAKEQNINLIKWWVADNDPKSFDELFDSCDRFRSIKHVLVKSLFRAPKVLWTQLDKDPRIVDAKSQHELASIEFPRLFQGLLDRLRSQSITAYDGATSSQMNVLDRSTMKRWLAQVEEEVFKVHTFEPIISSVNTDEPSQTDSANELNQTGAATSIDELDQREQNAAAISRPQAEPTHL